MARGAAVLCAQLHVDGKIDAMLALGGTMGTDLALDCAQALPMGVPKYIVSTVSFSPLIPADRLSSPPMVYARRFIRCSGSHSRGSCLAPKAPAISCFGANKLCGDFC